MIQHGNTVVEAGDVLDYEEFRRMVGGKEGWRSMNGNLDNVVR
jgi:hypothetical protein